MGADHHADGEEGRGTGRGAELALVPGDEVEEFEFEIAELEAFPGDIAGSGGGARLPRLTARRATALAVVVAAIALGVAVPVALVGRSSDTPVTATATSRYTFSLSSAPLELAESGDERWTTELDERSTGNFVVGAEVAAIAATAADGGGRGDGGVDSGADGGGASVIGLDLDDGRVRWSRTIDTSSTVQLAAMPFGVVFAQYRSVEGRSTLVALDEASGEVRWERTFASGERPAVFTGIDALVSSGVGLDTRFIDPQTGEDIGRFDGVPISFDRQGSLALLADDRVSTIEFDRGTGTPGEPRVIAVDPGGLDNVFYVLGDRVVRFDRDGAATLLATPFPSLPGRGQGEVGLEVVGTAGLVPTGGIGIDDTRLVAIADDRVVGLELVDNRLELRWERPAVPLAFFSTRETWVLRIGDGGNRSQVDSPTRLIDARDGRRIGGVDFDIVQTTQLLDDGLVVQDPSDSGSRQITAYRLDGDVAWTADAEGPAVVGDGVVVVLEVGPEGTVVTALGPPS